jgi:hypothetical protein
MLNRTIDMEDDVFRLLLTKRKTKMIISNRRIGKRKSYKRKFIKAITKARLDKKNKTKWMKFMMATALIDLIYTKDNEQYFDNTGYIGNDEIVIKNIRFLDCIIKDFENENSKNSLIRVI